MLLCRNPTLEKWQPDFSSSEQRNPTWIRVRCAGVELCNALNWIEWKDNPVQLRLCDACGYVQCESGGYVHVSRAGDDVLWTAPQLPDADEWARTQYEGSHAIRQFGAVLVPAEEWARWQETEPKLPAVSSFQESTGVAIADAWRMSARGAARAAALEAIGPLLQRRLLGSDTLDSQIVVGHVERLVKWLRATANLPMGGRFVKATTAGVRVEKLYFDGPQEEDWPALALGDRRLLLAFDADCVFLPNGDGGITLN